MSVPVVVVQEKFQRLSALTPKLSLPELIHRYLLADMI